MNLNQTILNECREEVAKTWEQGFKSAEHFYAFIHKYQYTNSLQAFEKNVAVLAMDRQAEFFRWASEEQYLIWSNNYWVRFKTYEAEGHHFTLTGNREHGITELELYNIWREGQRNEG